MEGQTLDDKTLAAEDFLRGLKDGTPATLVAEPDNPIDENAIAVYIKYRHSGYIKHECCDEVIPLLDSNGHCEAVVCGNDGHLTFTIDIPNAPDNVQAPAEAKRCLPESVLPRELIMPFSKKERQLQFVALKLDGLLVKEDNVDELIEMTNVYLPLSRLSLSKDDNLWRDHIYKKVAKALKLSITDEQKRELEHARDTLYDTQGDFHRTHENLLGKVFEQQLSQLSQQAKKEDGLYAKFEEYLTSSRKAQSEVIESLKGWFAEMPRVKLRDYHDHDQLAMSLNYLKVSRRELYEVYSAILLIERYERGEADNVKSWEDLLPKELSSEEAKEMIETAIEAGLIEIDGYKLKWTKSKQLLAYYAEQMCKKLNIGNGEKTSWKPFENLFNETGLKNAKQDAMRFNCRFEPNGYAEIDNLFE
jgi:hypothetical protein